MEFWVVLVLVAAGAVLWSRLTKALGDIAILQRDVHDIDQAVRTEEARLRREFEAIRAELRAAAGAPRPISEHVKSTTTTAAASGPLPRPPAVPPPIVAAVVLTGQSDRARPESTIAPSSHVGQVQPAETRPAAVLTLERESLETRIGSRWLLYIGVVAIVFGAGYFVKLALDNQWITETGRVVISAVVGALLVYAGVRFTRAGYVLYGQMLSGGGIAVLYVSIYGAFNFYHLISRPVAFTLMFVVTAAGAWLADRQRSQALALMATGGGFVTPFLLAGGADAQVALFLYDATLVGGTMYLARRQEWPVLNLVSYLAVAVTFAGWAGRFYAPSKYLMTEVFLTLFCGMFVSILYETRRSEHPLTPFVRLILWSAPVVYYFASLGNLANHSVPLLIFLIALGIAGIATGRMLGSSWIRLLFWVADVAPLLLWIGTHAGTRWLTAGLVTVGTIYLINLMAQLDAILRSGERLDEVDIGLLHGNGLATCGAAYLLIDPVHSPATAPVVAAFALWHAAIAIGLARRDRGDAIHAGALAFTLLTAAIALAFDGAWVTAGWAAEGAVVIWLGLRERRTWLRVGGLLLFAAAISWLLGLQFAEPPLGQTLLFNRRAACSVFIIALTFCLAWTHHRQRETLGRSTEVAVALVSGTLLVLALACSEIIAYWMLHQEPPFVLAAEIVAAFSVMGVAIVGLGLVRREEWVRVVGGASVALAVMSLLAIQFEVAPASYRVLWNARAGAGALVIAGFYLLAALHRRIGAHLPDLPFQISGLLVTASLLTLSLLTSEINAFWEVRGEAHAWSIAREALQIIAWSGLGATILWLGLTRHRLWIRLTGWTVLAVAVARLLRLEASQAPVAYVVFNNPRLTASVVIIALLYGLAALYRRIPTQETESTQACRILLVLANVLTLVFLTSEITAFWDLRHASAAAATSGRFAREVMLSITWAVYATGLIVVGIRKDYAPIRYFAIVVFGITIVKVFAIDLAELDRIYRVLSILGLGVMLLVTSYLYQRSRPKLEA